MPPAPETDDLLALVGALDARWHGQTQAYEREALTRFFHLLTLPARLIDPEQPARMAQRATIVRNARFTGPSVRAFFFEDQRFTEVDGIIIGPGSALGHRSRAAIYVVEVERKARDRNADYLRAMQRARKICALFARRFDREAWPVLIYDDRRGALSYTPHEDGLVALPMQRLRAVTEGLSISAPAAIPGRAGDRVMVKLELLWQIARRDPDDPWRMGRTAAGLADSLARDGVDLRLPVVGHQDLDQAPTSLDRWLEGAREDRRNFVDRVAQALGELTDAGVLRQAADSFALTHAGGDVLLAYSRFRDGG